MLNQAHLKPNAVKVDRHMNFTMFICIRNSNQLRAFYLNMRPADKEDIVKMICSRDIATRCWCTLTQLVCGYSQKISDRWLMGAGAR